MICRTAPSLAVLMALIVAAGCGDDGSEPSDPPPVEEQIVVESDPDEFLSEVDATCREITEGEPEIDNRTLASLNESLDDAVPYFEASYDRLASLEPPEVLASEYDAYLDTVAAQVPILQAISRAAGSGDADEVDDLYESLDRARAAKGEAALRIGVEDCGLAPADDEPASSGDEAGVRSVVEMLLTPTDPGICSELFTEDFLRRIRGGGTGDDLVGCESEVRDRSALDLDVGEVSVSGNAASVQLSGPPPISPEIELGLVRDGDSWDLDSLEVLDFDREGYLANLRRQVLPNARQFGTVDRARCLLRGFAMLSDDEIIAIGQGLDDRPADRIRKRCGYIEVEPGSD